MKKELIFCSSGLYPEQITLETIAALKKCGKVFFTCVEKEQAGLLLSILPAAELLSGIPLEMLELTVMGAFARHGRVGVLDYGDPAFLCAFSENLRRKCLKTGVGFRQYRAVSSLTALIADLGLGNLAPAGLYLATVHSWDTASRFIDPAVPLLLFSPDRTRLDGDPQGLLARVVKDLRRVYAPEHAVYFIRCANSSSGKSSVRRTTVAGLSRSLSALEFDTTIYLPAGPPKKRG